MYNIGTNSYGTVTKEEMNRLLNYLKDLRKGKKKDKEDKDVQTFSYDELMNFLPNFLAKLNINKKDFVKGELYFKENIIKIFFFKEIDMGSALGMNPHVMRVIEENDFDLKSFLKTEHT